MKRIFLIHGWEGHPNNNWFPWLKRELEKRKFNVNVPSMPNPSEPKIETWVSYLAKQVKKADENTYFVGHSIGCQTIMRYLEIKQNKIGGCVFVAPWMSLDEKTIEEEGEDILEIAKPWIETPVDFDKVKKTTNKFIAIFSDNDPYVPLKENSKVIRIKLGAEIIIEKDMGHFDDEAGIKKLPSVLNALLKIAGEN